jgi:hypothetical protein
MSQGQQRKSRRAAPKAIILLALALVSFLVLTAGQSGALFARSSANPGNAFAAGTLALTNSKNGAVVVSATGLMPGGSATGTLTVATSGNVSSVVTLTGTDDNSALAQALSLKIEDVTSTAQTLWSGTMSDFSSLSLGSFSVGASKSYRFTVTFPAANASSSLLNASTSMTLRFTGVA